MEGDLAPTSAPPARRCRRGSERRGRCFGTGTRSSRGGRAASASRSWGSTRRATWSRAATGSARWSGARSWPPAPRRACPAGPCAAPAARPSPPCHCPRTASLPPCDSPRRWASIRMAMPCLHQSGMGVLACFICPESQSRPLPPRSRPRPRAALTHAGRGRCWMGAPLWAGLHLHRPRGARAVHQDHRVGHDRWERENERERDVRHDR
jgi:hypothetical protein